MNPHYQDWIRHIFDHKVYEGTLTFEENPFPMELSDQDIGELISVTFERCREDLLSYSDSQIAAGIWFLTSPGGAGYTSRLRDGDMPTPIRVEAVRAIFTLYDSCFARRCTETLSHSNTSRSSALNDICYMFWDISPLSCLDETSPDVDMMTDAIFECLTKLTFHRHCACAEAGLHGLGHMAYYSKHSSRAAFIIDKFLANSSSNHQLNKYAQAARTGSIE
jgi:hypothetical protein